MPPPSTVAAPTVHRVEVRLRNPATDPRAASVAKQAAQAGLKPSQIGVARVYLIEADLSPAELKAVHEKLLADPVSETATPTSGPSGSVVEVHPLPGVMDPAAQSVRDAIADLTGKQAEVSTGMRYDLAGVTPQQAEAFARRSLCNPVIHAVHTAPFHPAGLPKGHEQPFAIRQIPIRDLTDDQLNVMSREAHLFLSLDEMKAVQAEYRTLGRDPRDIELETIAQTWSEHCVHKTLKSTIRYKGGKGEDVIRWEGRPGHTVAPDGTVTIKNLLKSTVAAATFELIDEGCDWALSVFKDNSGVIALDDQWAVNIKVETHNRPSAIEPYGGAATGIGGCIRDVIGTGLGAKPIASTDVFCVAMPEMKDLPPGCLPPKRILTDVVAGIRDYGNRMGIPTVSGGVFFDSRHVGNPLVFAGCIGMIPRHLIKGKAQPGDRIIALGGRTGRDGVHGATFSSAELGSNASTEFAHAVQIGNAIEEKRVLDAIMRARDAGPLYNGMTDCGAGGFSSAVGEMGGEIGAEVHLERAPLKYAGLTYTEIWISEAQERMVLAVPEKHLAALTQICAEEGVPMADLGQFGTPGADLILNFKGTEVGRLPMSFLHDGIPMPTRDATHEPHATAKGPSAAAGTQPTLSRNASVQDSLLALLAHPNIASKHWIIRQYDHEVQGNVIAKPLVGPAGRGPGDAAVLEPVAGSGRGISLSQGLQTPVGDAANGGDAYLMVLAAVDEVVRNLVCVGTDPTRIAILDNFCWPSCGEPRNLATLVRAAEGCYDAAKAYRTPFVSGKDSLNNQLRYKDPATGEAKVIEIPPTLLVTGIGIVPSIARTVTMDAKAAGNVLIVVGARTTDELGATHLAMLTGEAGGTIPRVDLKLGPAAASAVAAMIKDGLIVSAHDCSEGGVLAAAAEMLIASGSASKSERSSTLDDLLRNGKSEPAGPSPLGLRVTADIGTLEQREWAFAENPSRYVLEVREADLAKLRTILTDHGRSCGGLWHTVIGRLDTTGVLAWDAADLSVPVESLFRAWHAPLDW
ncbi:MAG: phosphoribosylformylglycinamidine synthase [Tepidisphaera sp.]